MRVAFLVGAFPKLSETFILNQVTGLLDRGHDVTVFANRMPDGDREHDLVDTYGLRDRTVITGNPDSVAEGAAAFARSSAEVLGASPAALTEVVRALRHWTGAPDVVLNLAAVLDHGEQFDIYHSHFAHVADRWRFLPRLLENAPFVVTCYGYDVTKHVHPNDYDTYHRLWPVCDRVIGITRHVQSRAILLGCPEVRTDRVHIGVDTDRFDFSPRTYDGDGPLRLATVARFVEKKGLRYAVEAIARLRNDSVPVRWEVAGDGPLRESIEARIVDRGIEDVVTLTGWATQPEVRDLLDRSHVFVLPSVTAADGDMEGQALVIQEAQATGLPVVSTYHDGIPEGVVEAETGRLVPERDPAALANALRPFAEAPETVTAFGRRGRELVEERFDNHRLAAEIEEIYEQVADAGR